MEAGAGEEAVIDESSGSLRRTIGLFALASGTLTVGSMLTVVIPVLPNIAKEVAGAGGSMALPVQMLIAMPMLGLVIGGLLSTLIFARFRARSVFLGGLVLYALVGSVGFVASIPVMIGSRLLMGIICACIGASSTALVGERVSPARRPRILGFTTAGASAGAIIAMLISGRVADAAGWRACFLIFPALAALVFLIAVTCSAPSAAPLRKKTDGPGNWSAILALWPIFLFVVVVNLTAFTTNSQSSFVLAGEGVTSSAGRAQVMSLNQLMIVVAAISFPYVRNFIGARFMPALILLVMGSGLLMLGMTHGMLGAAVALAVLGCGNGWLFPYQSSLLLQRAAPGVRGQAAGLMVSSQFLADAVNPLALGPVIITLGLKNSIALIGLVALVGCVCAIVVGIRYLHNTDGSQEQRLMHG
jgi:predicted MFS family arabinose efflux permease